MSKTLEEQKLTSQLLAILVVILALALGICVGKQQAWFRPNLPFIGTPQVPPSP